MFICVYVLFNRRTALNSIEMMSPTPSQRFQIFFFPFFPTNKKKNPIITSACYFALGSGAATHPDWLPPSATTLQSLLPLLSPGSAAFEAFSNTIETWEFGRLLNIGASAVHMTASVSPNVSRQPALTVKHGNLPFSAL